MPPAAIGTTPPMPHTRLTSIRAPRPHGTPQKQPAARFEVHTPKPDCFLNGITRQTVVGMLEDRDIKVNVRHIMPDELDGFEQCWLTGTAAEVTPVGQIGDYTFEVGDLAREIEEGYEQLVRA